MPRLAVVLVGDGDAGARDRSLVSTAGQDVDLVVLDTSDGTDSTYLAFLPVGDEVAPGGYAALLAALDESGSDAAIGRTRPAPTGKGNPFSRRRIRTTVEELPLLLRDATTGSTVWRRSSWEHHTPPGTPTALAAGRTALGLAAATAVDVLPEVVLLHQQAKVATRSARASDLAAVADRLETHQAVSNQLGALQRTTAKAAWDSGVIGGDLQWALSQLTEADDETQARIVETAGAFLVGAGPEAELSQLAIHRLQMHLARRRLLPQLVEVVKAERTGELAHTRAVRRGLGYYGDYPFRTDRDLKVPREVYRLDRELRLRTRVDDVRWEGEALVVEGIAHISLLDVASPRAGRLWLYLVPADSGKTVRLPVERRRRPDVTADSKESAYNYDWSGFRTTIPVAALAPPASGGHGTTWRLRATVVRGGVRRRRLVTATSPGPARRPALRDLPDGSRIVATTESGAFAIEVDPMPVVVDGVSLDGPDLVLTGRVREAGTDQPTLELDGDGAAGHPVTVRAAPHGQALEARLPVDSLTGENVGASLVTADGNRLALRAASSLEPVRLGRADGSEVRVGRSRTGRLQLTSAAPRAELVAATWPEGGELLLRLRDLGDDELVMQSLSAQREIVVDARHTDTGQVATLDPARVPSLAGRLPLTHGTWQVGVRRRGSTSVQPLAVDPVAVATLPVRRTVGAKLFTLREVDGLLQLVAGPDLRDDERGAVNQRRLQRVELPAFLAQGLRDEVLFESYQSRAYADNARAVYEELARRDTGLRCRWVVLDGQTELPEGLEPVRHNSREHYEALARSRYVVVPNYRPLRDWFTTPDDQVVVQTWHGAPFKRIGFDNERGERASSRDYHERLLHESGRWDYLLSPNPPSTPILRGAFGYQGAMLETGYPRTDVFFRPDRDERADRVRARLGLPAGKKVVLYAPTMRDDLRYGGNRFSLDLQLDLDKARAELAADHVLLVRRHAKVVDTVRSADGEFARDVSLWPDVNELLLATDVLITDYSSLMFDFANTGRPMLFFTYDLEDYRDRLRGFYFDVERVPGPLLPTSDEVIAGIRDAAALRAQHDSTYRAFVEDFCTWDDGAASARFVDEVFTRH